MKKILAGALISLLGISALFSQSAKKVTEVLESQKLTYGQACYFFATSSSLVKDTASYEDALKAYQNKSIIKPEVKADDAANLNAVALLALDVFKIKGSLALKLFPNARNAYRQLKEDGIFTSEDDPSKIPSGRRFLAILTDCMDFYESDSQQ